MRPLSFEDFMDRREAYRRVQLRRNAARVARVAAASLPAQRTVEDQGRQHKHEAATPGRATASTTQDLGLEVRGGCSRHGTD